MSEKSLLSLASAVQDFHRARRRAAIQAVMARLASRSVDLLSYEDVRQKLRARESSVETLEEIPLEAIVGSVGRYADFTRDFLPRRDSDEERWARVKLAFSNLSGVPPIEVYRIDEVYFVRDGNHRVSVARQMGATHIQAYVTDVRTRVPLAPDVQPDDLIVKAEYTDFLVQTRLDKLCPQADLSVTIPGQYQILEEHIAVHRYFMGREQEREVPYEEAVVHWYDEVYQPVVETIRELGTLRDFPDRTEADLYLWISEHRAALAEELGWDIQTDKAAADLASRYSPRPQRVASRVRDLVLDAVTPDSIEAGPAPGTWREERLASSGSEAVFSDILVAVNGEEAGWNALEQAFVATQREDGRLHGLHVVSSKDEQESDEVQALQNEFNRRCQEIGVPGRLAIEVGDVARQICQRARWADLIVLSLSFPPKSRSVRKSGWRNIIRRCPRPVLAIPGEPSPLNRALLAYDGSPKADEALFVATYLSGQWDISLVVVTVIEKDRTPGEALDRAQEYLESHGIQATYVEKRGAVVEGILEIAQDHQSELIILGGYGFSPVLEMVLGSTVDHMLNTCEQPMLICR